MLRLGIFVEKNIKEKRIGFQLSGNLIPIMKNTAELAGFEVVGRIVLKDKHTGKEYR